MRRVGAERGFSVIELMVVLAILAVLARIAIPVYQGVARDAVASQVAGDFNVVRAAAIAQFEATGQYAPDGPTGVAPQGMAPFLPREFRFSKPQYRLDWENWVVADSAGSGASAGIVLALTVVTPDERLGRSIVATLGRNCTHWTVDDASTFVIASTLESPL